MKKKRVRKQKKIIKMGEIDKPGFLPSGLRHGVPFVFNPGWTTEEAVAVVELLDDLSHAIWGHYQIQLYDYMREHRCGNTTFDSKIDESEPF
jgi:hypothetical protein